MATVKAPGFNPKAPKFNFGQAFKLSSVMKPIKQKVKKVKVPKPKKNV